MVGWMWVPYLWLHCLVMIAVRQVVGYGMAVSSSQWKCAPHPPSELSLSQSSLLSSSLRRVYHGLHPCPPPAPTNYCSPAPPDPHLKCGLQQHRVEIAARLNRDDHPGLQQTCGAQGLVAGALDSGREIGTVAAHIVRVDADEVTQA